jgi:hypothetical protein
MLLVKLFVVNTWLIANGIEVGGSSLISTIVVAVFCFGIFIVSNYINVKKTVNKLGGE